MIKRTLPDEKYKAVVGNTLAGGSNPFGTESEITDVIETTIEVNGLTSGIQGTSADVVTKLLGSDWRLPTLAEYQELLECCTVGHTRKGGFDIPIVTSNTTHNVLRFVYYNNNYHGSTRLTSNVDSVDITKAATFYANAENWTASTATIDRYKKVAIRPVTDNPNLGVDMGCPSGVRWASRDLGATTDWNTGNQYAFGEITTKAEYTWDTYLCAQAECGTTEDPLSHVTKSVTSTVLHKDNTTAHLNPVKEARWDGKQDALGFTPENPANKKTTLDDNSDTYYPTQKAVKTAVDAKADDTKVAAIQGLIPTQASPTNQLADKDFVNSSIGTSTAIFRGTFTSVDDLPTTGVDNNDYAFVKIFDPIQTDEVLRYDRYKWSDGWSFEYSLNNSSFTAAQWDTINSNATASIISDLLSHASNISNPHAVTKSQVGLGDVDNTSDLNKPLSTAAVAEFATKQDALGFTPENSTNKKTTLDDNSDTYYPTQKAVKTAVDVKVTGAASSVANEVPVYDGTTGKVLKSGSGVSAVGGNLTIGGTITANGQQILPQKQSDWNQTTSTESDYILNKPAIKAGQGVNSIIEGYSTKASGYASHAEGQTTTASGDRSHTEGNGSVASGSNSHAEGGNTTASGQCSHAEGQSTTASGNYSHGEGKFTTASGYCSHAEGSNTTASGYYSHAEGYFTTANHKSQHVFGEFNIADPSPNQADARGNYVEIVGKGTDDTHRSNARTLDWSGNETLAGNLTIGGTIRANGQQILPQKQADWNQTTSTESDYILNKPTKLSDFINDGEGGSPADPFVTESDVDEIRVVISNGATSQNKLITQSEAQKLVNTLSLSPIMADASGAKSFDFESPVYGALVSGSTNLEAGPWYKNEGNGFELCNSTTGVYVSLNDSAVVIDDESLFFYFVHGYRYQRIKIGVQGVYGKIKTPYGETVDLNYTDGSTLSGKFANTPCIYFYDDNNMFGHSGRVIYVCRATNLVSKTNAAEEYLVGASGTINDIMQGTDPDNTYDLVYPTTKYVCTQAQTASTDPVWAYRVTISESSSLADVAFTGSYADLQNTPKKLSDFTNDGNGGSPLNPFVTRNELEATPAEWDYIMGN